MMIFFFKKGVDRNGSHDNLSTVADEFVDRFSAVLGKQPDDVTNDLA